MNKTFSSPVDAGNYLAGFGTAKGARVRSINYDTGVIRFSLIAANDSVAAEVNAITVGEPSEATAPADIRAVIAATISE